MTKVKIILIDDHAVVRAGFKLLLAGNPAIEVVGEAERGEAVCQLYQDTQPDVVVLDLSMPGIGGLETIRRLCGRDPGAKILVFSVHDEMVYVERAIAAGAKGYITKNSAPAILAEAVHKIAQGRTYLEAGLNQAGLSQLEDCRQLIASLSPREFDVFRLLASGMTVHKVADELCLGYKTVANYSTQVKAKLNVGTLAELARVAIALGVIES